VFHLLEAEGFTCWLLGARHVKNVPGRPKTDRLDAVWLAKVVERGMCRPSLVHPRPIRRLRDLTRYRRTLVRERTREKQRLEKVLEDAQIKLDSVITNLLGVSGRSMLEALIAGERDPGVLAALARGRMRGKRPRLREALSGHFEDHHAVICATMLRRIDALAADIAGLDVKIAELVVPFAAAVTRLDEIPGVGMRSAEELIAEIGVDMTVFPTAAHLVSWAKFAPIDRLSAGRTMGGSTGKGNPWLAATLGEVVVGLSRTDCFLGDRYRRLSRRRGKNRALVAVGNSVLTILWPLLSDPDARYHDLGAGYHESQINRRRRQRDLVRQLETVDLRGYSSGIDEQMEISVGAGGDGPASAGGSCVSDAWVSPVGGDLAGAGEQLGIADAFGGDGEVVGRAGPFEFVDGLADRRVESHGGDAPEQ
jgi:transposase